MEGENAISEAHDAVNNAISAAVDTGAVIADSIMDSAQARIDDAEAVAQQIADAALASELGQRIGRIETEHGSWRVELETLATSLQGLRTELSELRETMAASLTLQVASQMQETNPSTNTLTPQVSAELKEATEEVTAALPGNLSESAVVENPVPPMPRKAKRFL